MLDNGQIAEEGSPEELMAKKDGRFYKMYTDQRLDALTQTPPKANMITGKFSMGPADANQILVSLTIINFTGKLVLKLPTLAYKLALTKLRTPSLAGEPGRGLRWVPGSGSASRTLCSVKIVRSSRCR